MGQDLTKLYERSKIGPTVSLAFTDGGSTRVELLDDTDAQANKVAPSVFMVRVTADVHLRQGNNAVEASISDLLLPEDSYYQLLAEDARDNHLAAIGPSGSSGTVYLTKVSDVD
jgi:hypothetical protein